MQRPSSGHELQMFKEQQRDVWAGTEGEESGSGRGGQRRNRAGLGESVKDPGGHCEDFASHSVVKQLSISKSHDLLLDQVLPADQMGLSSHCRALAEDGMVLFTFRALVELAVCVSYTVPSLVPILTIQMSLLGGMSWS